MSKPTMYRLGLSALARSPATASFSQAPATRITVVVEEDKKQQRTKNSQPQLPKPVQVKVRKTFDFHIGGTLKVPTADNTAVHMFGNDEPKPAAEATSSQAEVGTNPFDGIPLKAWAESLGERVMPAFEQIREEQRQAKRSAQTSVQKDQPVPVPTVPHFLPFTRWVAQSKTFQDTFIADDPKTRKKARLSWYHPDDTMVPRDWFRGGLLEDLKYYSPFRSASA